MNNREPKPYLEPGDVLMVLSSCAIAWLMVKLIWGA